MFFISKEITHTTYISLIVVLSKINKKNINTCVLVQVDDQELQDEPLQIRLMDHDTYSANDAIGKVYVDLNPLLLPPPCHLTSQRPHDPSQPGGLNDFVLFIECV